MCKVTVLDYKAGFPWRGQEGVGVEVGGDNWIFVLFRDKQTACGRKAYTSRFIPTVFLTPATFELMQHYFNPFSSKD